MALNTQSANTILTNAVQAVQGATLALVDFTVGSISLALMQAVMGIALWLQTLIVQVAGLTRLATSFGSDVDTWLADFGMTRAGATYAQGAETFGRYTPTLQAQIPVGTVVQSADGTQLFSVIADTTKSAWNANLNAYVIAAGVTTCVATVQAQTSGTGGNVALDTVTVLGQSIPGVDYCTNAAAFSGGNAAASDTAAKAQFVTNIENLAEGTVQACINAVTALQVGATCTIVENYNYSGYPQPGYFYAIVDNGTGSPPSGFLTAAYNAINAVRAEGTTFGVFAPSLIYANVSMTITVASGYTLSTVEGLVNAALTTYINNLGEATTLPYSKLGAIAWGISGVTNVTNVLLNSGTVDLVPTNKQEVRAGTITVGP